MLTWEEMVDFYHDYKPLSRIECYVGGDLVDEIDLEYVWDINEAKDIIWHRLFGDLCEVVHFFKVFY